MGSSERSVSARGDVAHRKRLDAIVDFWMPRQLLDPEREQRSRLVIGVTLLTTFGSLAGVRRATREELVRVVGIKCADAVLAHFASQGGR